MRSVWCLTLVLASGCFSYRTAEPVDLREGRDVRVHMTRLGFATLPEIPGQSGPELMGRLVSIGDDGLRLHVPVAVQPSLSAEPIAQEVTVPTRDVVRFEVREFSAARSGLVIGGGILAAAVLYVSFEKGDPPNPDEPEPPEEEEGFVSRLVRAVRLTVRF